RSSRSASGKLGSPSMSPGFVKTGRGVFPEIINSAWYSNFSQTQQRRGQDLAMSLRKLPILIMLLLVNGVPLFAEGTRTWEQSKYEDLVKGTSHGVAISSDGTLQLAPAFKLVASTPSSAVWATPVGPQGEV